jgi:poly-gamma-glutamate capsule biosynthesis protein CapA/YwtB (metallophosphatase superfamily)
VPADARPVTLAIAGDVMLGRLVDASLDDRDPGDPWRDVKPLLRDADAFLFNLECAVCGPIPEWEPARKTFHFRLDPRHLDTLTASGVDAVGLANNHVMDHGEAGLLETLEHLDRAGIRHAGAGRNSEEARAPVVFDVANGTRVGLVHAADHPVEWEASAEGPGIFLIDPASRASVDAVLASVAAARAEGADVVVLGLHWGPNMRRTPPRVFRWFAKQVIASGVDILWGTSAHICQGVEFHGNRVALYDTGDFLDDYIVDPVLRNDLSFLYRVTWTLGVGVDRVELDPVRIKNLCTRRATADEAAVITDIKTACSREFGTRFQWEGARLVTRPG